MKCTNRLALALLLALAVPITASAQRGARTLPLALDQLVEEAPLIVRGTVTSARVEPHPQLKNLMTVVVSMNVEATLKGKAQNSLQFRQYIWDIRDQLDAASYMKGQRLLLMLGPVSQVGLTSPVGLEQGRFRISLDSTGQPVAVNGAANLGLFESVASRAQQRNLQLSPRIKTMMTTRRAGPVPLADLETAIRTLGAQP